MKKDELDDLKHKLNLTRSLRDSTNILQIERLIADYEAAVKSACDTVNATAMDDRIRSNIEWQRNWAQERLAALGIQIPHPEHEESALIEKSEARVAYLKMLIEKSEKEKEPQ